MKPMKQPGLKALDPSEASLVQHAHYLLTDQPCTIGRDSGCTVIIYYRLASRCHAVIERNADPYYYIRDYDSENGTFINKQRITIPYRLRQHDQIGFGHPNPLLVFDDPEKTQPWLPIAWAGSHFSIGNQILDLSPDQSRLLEHLFVQSPEWCSARACFTAVWNVTVEANDQKFSSYQALLRDLVYKLRQRLKVYTHSGCEYIENERGRGYRLFEPTARPRHSGLEE